MPSVQPDIEAEAQMLAGRSALERADYLFEVAHCPHRGPDVADQLQRMVFWIHEGRSNPTGRTISQPVGDFLT